MNHSDDLEEIATKYHLDVPEDIDIENQTQLYEFDWVNCYILPNSKVLDLGIGDGLILELLLKEMNNKEFELDVVEGSIQICKKYESLKPKGLKIFNSLFENFEARDKYDLIIMSHVLEHVQSPVELLNQFSEYLKKDGLILGIVPNKESIHRRLAVLMGIQEKLDSLSARDLMVGHLRVYSKETLLKDLEICDLMVTEMRGFFFKPFANFQLMQLNQEIIEGLLKLGEQLPIDQLANIGFIARKNESIKI
jgi:2-polyprenyl-3-methyl-5-hydroxy-6-metoxy-1,4-benzoquinol methylase